MTRARPSTQWRYRTRRRIRQLVAEIGLRPVAELLGLELLDVMRIVARWHRVSESLLWRTSGRLVVLDLERRHQREEAP